MNISLYKSHSWVYLKTQRILFLIFSAVLIMNIITQLGVGFFLNDSFSPSLTMMYPQLFGLLIGALIAIPLMEVTAFPYLLMFGNRRKDILFSATGNHLVFNVIIAILFSALLATHRTHGVVESLPPLYMGVIVDSFTGLLIITLLNIFLFFTISNVMFLISGVFYHQGLFPGMILGSFVLSIPFLLIKELYQFFIWGGSYPLACLILFLISIGSLYASSRVLSRAEIRSIRPKVALRNLFIFVVSLAIVSSSLFFGIYRYNNENWVNFHTRARFGYWQGGKAENGFVSPGYGNLILIWRSQVEEGEMMFTLENPSGEVVSTIPSNTNEKITIPLTPGRWNYSISPDEAHNGSYSLRGTVK